MLHNFYHPTFNMEIRLQSFLIRAERLVIEY